MGDDPAVARAAFHDVRAVDESKTIDCADLYDAGAGHVSKVGGQPDPPDADAHSAKNGMRGMPSASQISATSSRVSFR